MDAIGIKQPVAIPNPAPAPRVSGAGSAASTPDIVIGANATEVPVLNSQSLDEKRFEAVKKLSQNIANSYVVSDKTFSIFKDSTGQYITRFTSLRDGKVTYIPEPSLFKLGGGSDPEPQQVLNINA